MKLNIKTGVHFIGRQIAARLEIKYLGIRVQMTEKIKRISFIFEDPLSGTRFTSVSLKSARQGLAIAKINKKKPKETGYIEVNNVNKK